MTGVYVAAAGQPGPHNSNGVCVLHAGFVRFRRTLPSKRLPPLLVMAFTTPPGEPAVLGADPGGRASGSPEWRPR